MPTVLARYSIITLVLVLSALTASGCAGSTSAAPEQITDGPSSTPTLQATPTQKPTPTPPPDADGDGVRDSADAFPTDPARSVQLYYPSGDPVLTGYPLIVETAQLDSRLANWIDTPQAVAVAPGVYAGYNPAVTDLTIYLDGPTDGDCAVREVYGFLGGACWTGVLASPAEPAA